MEKRNSIQQHLTWLICFTACLFGVLFMKPVTAKAVTTVGGASLIGTNDSGTGTTSGLTGTSTDIIQLRYIITDDSTAYISGYQYNGTATGLALILPSKITVGTIQYSVTGVSANAFYGCTYISSVTFQNTYTSIGAYAFSYCTGLSGTLTIGNGVTEIGKNAFIGCNSIDTVYIPESVSAIQAGAFASCANLTTFSVANANPYYKAYNYMLYSYDGTRLVQCPAKWQAGTTSTVQTSFKVASPVTTIFDEAFEGCVYLTTITMDTTVRTIGEKAFYGCKALTSITIPESVTYIGDYALSNCNSGMIVYCHKSSTGVAESFANSYSLTRVVTCTVKFYDGTTLLDTQEVISGNSAIAPTPVKDGYTLTWDTVYTNVTQNLTVTAAWKQKLTVTFKDVYSGKVSQVEAYYGGSATPPEWTRTGYTLSWDSTSYTYVTSNVTIYTVWLVSMTGGDIDDDLPTVGDTRTINYLTYMVVKAGKDDPRVKVVACTKSNLTSVSVPATVTFGGVTYKVTSVGPNAFEGMTKLKSLGIGKNVMLISKKAFYSCTQLKKIVVHSKKLKTIGTSAFSRTYASAKVDVPEGYESTYRTRLRDGGLSIYAKVY